MGARKRPGFERLLAAVAGAEVGIILSREASRLSRTDKDWCHLLEVCQLFDTLIGDGEQIYDPSLLDDQLVLGIKATLSVIEMKTLKMRLLQGMEAKARRGELIRLLPPGYVRDDERGVVLDPNERIQESIRLVLRKFCETWSVRQTYLWFHHHHIELPVNQANKGKREIIFKLPSHSFIADLLRNPIYAGAYVYGRRPTEMVLIDGKPTRRQGHVRDAQDARVFIRDHHEAYISWEHYEENQRMISRNSLGLEADESVGAVRSGQGLLAGLLRCGRCGRKLHVRYWGKSGTAARYLCMGDFDSGGRHCLGFGASTVDRRISGEIVAAVSPLGIKASVLALEQCGQEEDQRAGALARQLRQAEYEAQRAFEQYQLVDPRNRLVAAELERRWNAKLEDIEKVEAALAEVERDKAPLSQADRDRIAALGEHFEAVWHSEHCAVELKKKITRSLIEEIVVNLGDASGKLHFVIHWKGGTHTELEMDKPTSPFGRKTSLEDLEIIRKMAVRYGDDEIARVLNKLGRRTGKGKRWSQERVATARRNHTIAGRKRRAADGELLTLAAAAKYARVSDTTLTRLAKSGLLHVEQVVPWAPWEIRRCDLESEPLRSILEHVRTTGKLVFEGNASGKQQPLFL